MLMLRLMLSAQAQAQDHAHLMLMITLRLIQFQSNEIASSLVPSNILTQAPEHIYTAENTATRQGLFSPQHVVFKNRYQQK